MRKQVSRNRYPGKNKVKKIRIWNNEGGTTNKEKYISFLPDQVAYLLNRQVYFFLPALLGLAARLGLTHYLNPSMIKRILKKRSNSLKNV